MLALDKGGFVLVLSENINLLLADPTPELNDKFLFIFHLTFDFKNPINQNAGQQWIYKKEHATRYLGNQTKRFFSHTVATIPRVRCSENIGFYIFFTTIERQTHQTNIKNYNDSCQNPVFDLSKADHEGETCL